MYVRQPRQDMNNVNHLPAVCAQIYRESSFSGLLLLKIILKNNIRRFSAFVD